MNNKKDASYNDEDTYRGLGKYSGFLEKQIKRVQTVTDNLRKKRNIDIYKYFNDDGDFCFYIFNDSD